MKTIKKLSLHELKKILFLSLSLSLSIYKYIYTIILFWLVEKAYHFHLV